MPTFKKVLAAVAAILAVIGVLICLVIMWFSWSLNTPVTESLVGLVAGAEQLLTVVDRGLTRVDEGLETALEAVTTVEETVQSAGETIVETNLAFTVLERTVGDTLFPRLETAAERVNALTETIVAFNDTLEAANRLPLVDVPTMTDELQMAADRLDEARGRVEEIRADMRAIKEEKVGRPVAFVTDRTGPIADNLERALAATDNARTNVAERQTRLATLRERLPRLIDLISLAVTLMMAWLVAAQGFVLLRAVEYLTGRQFFVNAGAKQA